MSLAVAAGCAVAAGVAGWFVPVVVRRLPEPEPEPEPGPGSEPETGPVPEPGTEQTTGPETPASEGPAGRPRKPVPDFSLWGMHAIEREKELYRDIAELPGLALGCAIASALVAGVLGWKYGWYPVLAVVLPPVPVCVAVAVLDWRTRYIPTRLVLPATAYVLLAAVVLWLTSGAGTELVRGLIGLVVVRSFFWVLWFVRAAGMGFGDVRLAALLGLLLGFLGPMELFLGIWLGFLAFSLPGVLLALVKWDYRLMRVPFPFGPFMVVGALLGVLLGQPVADAVYG